MTFAFDSIAQTIKPIPYQTQQRLYGTTILKLISTHGLGKCGAPLYIQISFNMAPYLCVGLAPGSLVVHTLLSGFKRLCLGSIVTSNDLPPDLLLLTILDHTRHCFSVVAKQHA